MTSLPTIVIPYFKLRFLDEALASLTAQTQQGFTVFIGDDASPENPKSVLQKYEGRLNIRYHRFAENLGSVSLVRQWDRCVRMTDTEWIWLFSDDDLAAPTCVESFLQTLKETDATFDVYRFNTKVIDRYSIVTCHSPQHPQTEQGADFALAKAMAQRSSYAVEYIFRRSAFDAAGGFVEFPLAWFSDDASWMAFARRTGFRTMKTGEVLWRQSGLNLSSPKPELVGEKLAAFRNYLSWLMREFPDADFQQKIKLEIRRRFPQQLQHWGGAPRLIDGLSFWLFFAGFTGRLNLFLLRTFLGLTGFRAQLARRKAASNASAYV